MTARAGLALAACFVAVAAAGCGTATSPTPFDPCGGRLPGGWKVVGNELGVRTLEWGDCAVEIDLTRLRLDGMYWFREDGSYSVDLRASGDWLTRVPSGCRRVTSCSAVEAELRRLLRAPGEPDHPVTCTGSDECVCSHALGGRSMTDAGSYTVDATAVRLERGIHLDYCVRGDRLELRAVPGRGALGTDRDITGRLILVRLQ